MVHINHSGSKTEVYVKNMQIMAQHAIYSRNSQLGKPCKQKRGNSFVLSATFEKIAFYKHCNPKVFIE